MSILSQMVLIEKHGLRVDLETLANILGTKASTLRNRVSDQTLEIPTYLDVGKRWADTRDVAEYLDVRRAEAREMLGMAA